MLRGKYPAPANFSRLDPAGGVRFDFGRLGEDVYRLQVHGPLWGGHDSLSRLNTSFDTSLPDESRVEWSDTTGLRVVIGHREVLRSDPDLPFGVTGSSWIFSFLYRREMRFYGLGQKNNGFEKTGLRTMFYNVDVADEFSWCELAEGVTDPMYLSIPWLIVKDAEDYLGILLHNPYPSFMHLAAGEHFLGFHADMPDPRVCLGSTGGSPEVYLIAGSSLRAVVTRLYRLVGTMPRPPLWALGHHQSRWGYRSYGDLLDLDSRFAKYGIPTDGLWIDIDYMDGYRLFTFAEGTFDDPAAELADLAGRGRRVVPILDPGIRQEPGFEVYDEAAGAGLLCTNEAGGHYVGYAWPGRSVFPDFSLAECREWWAERVRRLAELGFAGFWCDMNEPATWRSSTDQMRHRRGTKEHDAFHNQYGKLMHEATREGLQQARPGERPFVISRAGYIGTGALGGVWNGDNVSNFHNLRIGIPLALNLSLSGVSFHGSDVPGFMGDADGDLMVAWYKAAFLFPLLRNHSCADTARQEPWAFGRSAREIVAAYIRLRYKLQPYLYNLMIEQETQGEPVLRPLIYEFADTPGLELDKVDDEFMVGSSILQAPILERRARRRSVVLPDSLWFDCAAGKWIMGARRIRAVSAGDQTPIFFRYGAIVPMAAGNGKSRPTNLADVELHIFVRAAGKSRHSYRYRFDDGISLAYRTGGESGFLVQVVVRDGRPEVRFGEVHTGHGPASVRLVFYEAFPEVDVILQDRLRTEALKTKRWVFAGHSLETYRSRRLLIE